MARGQRSLFARGVAGEGRGDTQERLTQERRNRRNMGAFISRALFRLEGR